METQAQIFNTQVVKNELMKAFKGIRNVMFRSDAWACEVVFYETTIATILPCGTVKLSNGGYETKTTKKHINTVLAAIGIKSQVTQKAWQWYLNGQEFNTNITINK